MLSKMRRSALALVLLLPLWSAAAQELPFTHFTPGDQVSPLSSASVQKITQDHLGYIWLAFTPPAWPATTATRWRPTTPTTAWPT